ncbi:tyrosine-type recombinase/integrase [Serratia marcescens]|uniref:tyrosine-type recombinase/integrase n=1 Tax=Serratia marcescens TaxID=615 RepID=UPI000669404B|nr:tyrosine-type recombinase/integrase [Serratia marcescens]MBH3149743.1 tyrosine-type recombinase/integrase [Serratia marcescens]MBH3164694.1 tyrosine-type recombinase/integrase [Serratia marcescens]HEJ7011212.1 tyrosine-type recombinase/integrase [Serratia marcescens]HEJ7201453.1 tyrosine-type recombinase/integrase [Serratia marcescens]HEJ7237754.1 tyrosine-type recombinase/integrase [Serratia marcescens]
MAKRQEKYDANLPKYLTYRKKFRSYYWWNPLTEKEIPLGRIARKDAIAQAIEANHYIEKDHTLLALMEILKNEKEFTLSHWLEKYDAILKRRKLAENTYKIRSGQIITIKDKLGNMPLKSISTLHISEFLEPWVEEGKNAMAAGLRSVMSDIFREAIVAGRIETNPVAPTRAPKTEVSRERLEYPQYLPIREAAQAQPQWFPLAMDLALVTGQRREDIANMQFTDVIDGRLYVEQMKTGMQIAIPLTLTLAAAGLTLGNVIERCRRHSTTNFLLSAGIRKNSPDGSLHPDGLTKGFVKARNNSGIPLSENPPTFHEIRSLAGRMYEKEYGKEFTQKLLGHTSEKMTQKYLDTRRKEFILL